MSRQELLDSGAPEEIAAFLGLDFTSTTTASVSADSITYAEELGGTSHQGETLYIVIGGSVETEPEAQATYSQGHALQYFGDMQSYFIVQRSDNFDGMAPGLWVVIEAYQEPPSAEQLDFAGGRSPRRM